MNRTLAEIIAVFALLALVLITGICNGQELDSIHKPHHMPGDKWPWIISSALIVSGSAIMLDRDADEFFLNNYEVREERNEHFINFSNHLDDYLQHVPSVTTFAMSIAGVQGKHDLANQTALFIKSELLSLSVTLALKYTVGEARPDTGKKNSFPSGHTTQAFTAATFLAKEYGYKSVWISIGAYMTATTVGAFRLLNNRHWLSDVVVGAGIGMLSANLVYLTHRNKWGKHPESRLTVSPYAAFGGQGLSISYKLF